MDLAQLAAVQAIFKANDAVYHIPEVQLNKIITKKSATSAIESLQNLTSSLLKRATALGHMESESPLCIKSLSLDSKLLQL